MTAQEAKPQKSQILLALGAFLAAFAFTAALIHLAIRDPLYLHADERSEKLEMLQQMHTSIFSAAFGSSHVHNGFDPRAFDRTLAGTPIATHTANLAISGGSQTEQRAMAMEFLRQLKPPPKPQPCIVLLELGAGANFTNDHLVHPRAINIYDLPTARFAAELTSPDMPRSQRLGRVGYAAAASSLYYLNTGMLSSSIFASPVDQAALQQETAEDRRGLINEPVPPGFREQAASIFASAPAKTPIAPTTLTPGNSLLIAQLAAVSPTSGVSFVYFLMPMVGDVNAAHDYPDHLTIQTPKGPLLVPILNLARPDRFPQLYTPDQWHDFAHLTYQGADLASTLLAQQLNQWYAAHGLPPHCGG